MSLKISITTELKWNGSELYFGKIKLASYGWNGGRPKNDPLCYRCYGVMPQIKSHLGDYATTEECITRLNAVALHFVEMLKA